MVTKVTKGVTLAGDKKTYCSNKQDIILIESVCTKRCTKTRSCKTFTQDQREAIHQAFWSETNWDEKHAFAVSQVDIFDARKQKYDGRISQVILPES